MPTDYQSRGSPRDGEECSASSSSDCVPELPLELQFKPHNVPPDILTVAEPFERAYHASVAVVEGEIVCVQSVVKIDSAKEAGEYRTGRLIHASSVVCGEHEVEIYDANRVQWKKSSNEPPLKLGDEKTAAKKFILRYEKRRQAEDQRAAEKREGIVRDDAAEGEGKEEDVEPPKQYRTVSVGDISAGKPEFFRVPAAFNKAGANPFHITMYMGFTKAEPSEKEGKKDKPAEVAEKKRNAKHQFIFHINSKFKFEFRIV